MESKLLYRLPEDHETVAKIAQAIPSNWCWISGWLTAPQALYDRGLVAENTQLNLRYYDGVKIVGAINVPYEQIGTQSTESKDRIIPQIAAVTLGGKLFSSIYFHQAGFERDSAFMDLTKSLIAEAIKKGYKGYIDVYSGYRNNHTFDNPERFSFTHANREKPTFLDPIPLPPHVALEWFPRYNGRRENLDGIVAQLEALGLEPLKVQE